NFPQPDSITKLKGFLAMGSYYRRFVKDFSLIVKPLTDATRGSPVKLTWTREGKLAFQKLKDVMSTPPVLAYPDLSKRFYLECDGSKLGLGCVLTQLGEDGHRHPLAYASRAVSRAEENMGATDLEACAVIYGMEHFDVYIRGNPTTIITDHLAL
ncbi:MAG: hypothetical protein GY799_03765, partial [Desulfobulbaceae bacterium]|nr:hypothetical protein [Desulfobulbaceae bacterium]